MSNEVLVNITAQSASAETAWLRLGKLTEGYNDKLAKIDVTQLQNAKSARDVAKAERELEQIRGQMVRSLRDSETAAQRYARKLDELQRLDAAGKITAEEFARSHALITKELRAADPAVVAATQRQKELAAAIKQVSAANQTAQDRYRSAVARLNELKSAGLSQEIYNKELRKERELLLETSGHTDRKRAKVAALNQTLATTGATGVSFADRLGTALGWIATAGGVMTVAAAQLRREYDALISRQKDAAGRQMDIVEARDNAMLNIGDDPELADGKADKFINQASQKTGASRKTLWNAFSAASSMKGTLSNQQAMAATEAAAALTPGQDAEIQANTQAAMQLMQADAKLTADAALGFILKSKEASPVVQGSAYAKNAVPAIRQGTQFGMTLRESSALNATIGSAIGDTEGAVTASAMTSFSKQLSEALPNVEGDTLDKLAALQSPENAKVKCKFLGALDKDAKNAKGKPGLEGEAKAFMTLLDLIQSPDSQTSRALKSNLEKTPEATDAAPFLHKTVDKLNADPMRQNMIVRNSMDVATEGLQLGDIAGGRGTITREGLQKVLKASGAGRFQQDLSSLAFEASTDGGQTAPINEVVRQLEGRRRSLETDQKIVRPARLQGPMGDVIPAETESVPTTDPLKRQQAAELGVLIDGLKRQADLQERTAKAIEQNNVKMDEQTKAMKDTAVATAEAAKASNRPRLNVNKPAPRPSKALAE